ncbi:MAG TPA: MBL fold metallo-hydrolase [Nitrososphaeraceae archaeon]|jgi:7,8-dihydropterin-6-yl-methyl-4-(beta-D-ribofuranosyl)aminobenzene 5'-phosphate synthase|nr:MBL fold metallo-hydrolase [Nitrososphaeraceae archaeon]
MPLKDIDSVEITCLVDNSVDLLLPNTKVAFRPSVNENWFVHPLIAEHGFCASITLEVKGTEHRLLFDSGLDPFAASHNAEVLDLDLSYCELVISSHGHIDHAGGLINIKRKINEEKQKQKLPLVLHEDAFKNRLVKFQDGRKISLPAPNRTDLIEAGYNLVQKQSTSLWIEDRILVTGEIPRTNDFEKGFPNHYSEIDGRMENDPLIKDDQAIVLNIKDKGLVVITGCAHAGIINIIKYAKELSGENRIYGVIGGMHLTGGVFEPLIPRTIDELELLKPRFIIPCHCSGLKAVTEIAKNMPNALIQNSVGTNYIF